jgi:cyclopropane-fatty-acyl-phospholipid synthase
MSTNKLKTNIGEMLSLAGVQINGNDPWDIRVNNDKFYARALAGGSLGIGEAYMEKMWDSPRLDQFFDRVLHANLDDRIKENWKLLSEIMFSKIFNRQSYSHATLNAQKHYDLGNELFVRMLDKRMVYTCGYWKDAARLDEAQEKKLDLTCRKLNLKSGMNVLDIGCGWGSFAKFAAENYGVDVTGITVSKDQVQLGEKMCEGLAVKIKLMDYRDMNEKFDCIVSLGMFEHVGYKNYRTYMKMANRCLRDDGLFLLHTIGSNTSETFIDPWIDKYIFPGGMLPSIKQIGQAIEGLFIMEDWHNFSADYDKTLMAWQNNFVQHWDELKNYYDEKFFRMWNYYLLMCAGSFRSRKNQLWQVVLSKNGAQGGYVSAR